MEEVDILKAWLLLFLLVWASIVRLAHTHLSTEQGSLCNVMLNCNCLLIGIYRWVCRFKFLNEYMTSKPVDFGKSLQNTLRMGL